MSAVPPGQGAWVWTTGEPYNFANWAFGEPNDSVLGLPGEDAVHIGANGRWNDNSSGIPPEESELFNYVVEYETGSATPFEGVSTGPPTIMPPNLPGTDPGPVGIWNIVMYRDSGLLSGCNLPSAINVITQRQGTILEDTSPVLNFYDTVSGTGDATNLLYPKTTVFPGDGIGGSNNFVMLAKTTIDVPEAGDYTFGVNSDDGMGLRVNGGFFVSETGGASIDAGDNRVWYFSGSGCNVYSRAVYHFDAPGQYVVEFIWFECGNNADVELYWAKGAFQNNSDTTAWRCSAHLFAAPPVLPPDPLPGPEGAEDSFGVRVFRPVTTLRNLRDALDAIHNSQTPSPTPAPMRSTSMIWTELRGPPASLAMIRICRTISPVMTTITASSPRAG